MSDLSASQNGVSAYLRQSLSSGRLLSWDNDTYDISKATKHYQEAAASADQGYIQSRSHFFLPVAKDQLTESLYECPSTQSYNSTKDLTCLHTLILVSDGEQGKTTKSGTIIHRRCILSTWLPKPLSSRNRLSMINLRDRISGIPRNTYERHGSSPPPQPHRENTQRSILSPSQSTRALSKLIPCRRPRCRSCAFEGI